jgi:hypothetical protein
MLLIKELPGLGRGARRRMAQRANPRPRAPRCTLYPAHQHFDAIFHRRAQRSRRVGTGFSERTLEALHGGMQKVQAYDMSLCESAGEKTREMGPGDHTHGYETLCLGRAGAGRPNQVH